MSEHILIERKGAVQVIRLNRPEKKNAITRAMYAAMAKALKDGDAGRCRARACFPRCSGRFFFRQ
ncbi:enoyl-CoA hydratase [Brucella melitensis]|nr:enoyl-CoA hydratase [Brucella melitensis]